MLKNWKKKDELLTIEEIVERQTGLSKEELGKDWCTPIMHLEKMAEVLKECIINKTPITIFADYDADGITSAVILTKMLKSNGVTPKVLFPKRSTGYGINESDIDNINEGVVLTVDNGIAALDAIKKAKAKGLTVFVLDHHLAGETLPDADIIVDPHVFKFSEYDFEDWCGAGLSYRLACLLVDDKKLLDELIQFAAIGTIADVVDLLKDNRTIVREGLKNINGSNVAKGIKTLLISSKTSSVVDEMTIGFTIAPIINAPSRVKDNAEIIYDFFVNNPTSWQKAGEIVTCNETRKALVKSAVKRARDIVVNSCMFADKILVIYDKETVEGIVGIVAGKICEEMKKPTIVLTDGKDGVLKGSARSTANVNIKELLDKTSKYLKKYGGHTGAAGLSLEEDNLDDFTYFINDIADDAQESEEVNLYSLEISAKEIPKKLSELEKFVPFGKGNPRIIFKINEFQLVPRMGRFSKKMGENEEHLKIFGNEMSGVGFGLVEEFNKVNQPKVLNLIGTLSVNYFGKNSEIQVEFIDFEESQEIKIKSPLQIALEKKLKKF